jgi:hypothetical protein
MGELLTPEALESQRDAFVERLLGDVLGAFNVFALYIGDRLGLYRALAEGGPATADELAGRAGACSRYVREWLEQQTLAGVIRVEDATVEAALRQFYLPAAHVEPLIQCESLSYLAPLAQLVAGAVRPLPALVDAYRDCSGVPYEEYGPDLRGGQGAMNYPAFARQLAQEWLPALPDVHARLQAEPPARIADIGCGFGWSSIGMAKGYPGVQVDGFDLDAPSVEQARVNALINGVADRAHFHERDAGDPELAGRYDLVTAFECIHDMAQPVDVLRAMRQLAGERGTVLIMDERVS